MGRFDALTQLDDEKERYSPAKPVLPSIPKKSDTGIPKEEERKASLLANSQTTKLANQQTSISNLSTKEKKKYGTYLRPDSIYAIKTQALQEGRDSHEIVQEIIDLYYQNHKN